MTTFVILVLLFSILAKQCHGNDSRDVVQAKLAHAINQFTFDLNEKLYNGDENIFFSPMSIMFAFTMISLGARGNTLKEIDSTFHLDEIKAGSCNPMTVHKAVKKILEEYGKENSNYSLSLASSMFAQKDYEIKRKFLDEVKKYYEATVENVDFGSGKAEGIINEWVENKTNNKIKDLFPPDSFTDSTRLVLANAIYYKGKWKLPFDEKLTTDEDFHVNNDTVKKVKMMKKYRTSFPYIEDSVLNSQVIELPYAGDELSMIVLLPKEKTGLSKFVSEITAEKLNNSMSKMRRTKINLQLPRIKLETTYSLSDVLGQMGIKDLFTEQADLTGISDERPLYVSQVIHKAYVDVNEEGTEAAAATGISVGATSVEETVDILVDHPFLFAIVHKRFDNEILFFGFVSNP